MRFVFSIYRLQALGFQVALNARPGRLAADVAVIPIAVHNPRISEQTRTQQVICHSRRDTQVVDAVSSTALDNILQSLFRRPQDLVSFHPFNSQPTTKNIVLDQALQEHDYYQPQSLGRTSH